MTDPNQPELWTESLEDALRDAVIACGGPKRIAATLWPAKTITDAARLLNHCLDPERAEKLSLGEIVLICRFGKKVGCHTPMHYLAQTLGYQTPAPVDPEDEKARLQREYIEAVHELQRLTRKIEMVDHLSVVKA